MSTLQTKKCVGLHTAGNRYDVPEGALVTATNVLIRRDGVIQPRWGLDTIVADLTAGGVTAWRQIAEFNGYLYLIGATSGAGTDTVLGYLNLASPAAPIILNSLDPPSGAGSYGSTNTPFYDHEFIKTNGCLYLNSFDGLRRIPDNNGSTSIVRAGGVPCAVAIQPRPLSTSLARSGTTTVTATTACAHGYQAGISVTMTSAGNGNFGAGTYTVVSVPSGTTFTYVDATSSGTSTLASQTFAACQFVGSSGIYADKARAVYQAVLVSYDTNGTEYVGEVSGRAEITNTSPAIGAGALKNAQVAVLFPAGGPINNTKVQLYRTPIALFDSTQSLTPPPGANLFKVYEKFLTAAEVAQGFCWISPESCPDSVTGEPLYVSSTQDGMLRNNTPLGGAKTIALWGDMLAAGNTVDRPAVELQLLSTDNTAGGLASGDILCLDPAGATNELLATNSGTALAHGYCFVRYSGGTPSTDVQNTVLSIIDTINWNAGASSVSPLATYIGTFSSVLGDWPGRFVVQKVTPALYDPTDSHVTSAFIGNGDAVAGNGTPGTRGCFAPKLGTLASVTTSVTAGVVTATTFYSGHKFEVGEYVVVYSTFSAGSVVQATLGGYAVEGKITAVASNTVTFTLPSGTPTTTGSGTMALRERPQYNLAWAPSRLKVSRHRSVEAFPPFYTLDIGQANKKILKMVPCGSSLMVFKEDGLFRVMDTGGDNEPNLTAVLVDATCILWAKDTAVATHNHVIAWLEKGVAALGEQGVIKYIGEPIYDLTQLETLQALPLSKRSYAINIPADDAYELRLVFANAGSSVNLIFNTFNNAWTTDTVNALAETVYQGYRYLVGGTSGKALLKQTVGGIYENTVVSPTTQITGNYTATSTPYVITATYTGYSPTAGSRIIIYNDASGILVTTWCVSSGGGVLTLYDPTGYLLEFNGGAGGVDNVTSIRTPVSSVVEWAPVTFTAEGQTKIFREFSVLFGLAALPFATAKTATELITTQETITCWSVKLGPALGTTDSVFTFAPAAMRSYVPQQHRRAQQLRIQVVLTCADSPWTILGLAVTGDVIGPRLSK